MKFNGQNSLAIPASVGNIGRKHGVETNLHAHGAKVLEAMGQLGKSSEGSQARFECLVKDHLESTTRLAVRLLGKQDLAEELVQETMLRAVRNWDSFRQQSQFKTWLYRILINAFRDRLRRAPKIELADIAQHDCLARDSPAESKAEATELAQLVAELIAKLPERQREVLVLATYETLSSEQIAQSLGITVANVHSNLSTARRKLKQQLAPYFSAE